MTEQQAIEQLHALLRLPKATPKLDVMRSLLNHLGNPERWLNCIHIAGTNGKGSLSTMTASILTEAGLKTGLTISPYVTDFRERFQIDGQMIPPETLAELTEEVLQAIHTMEREGEETPAEFLAVTAVALLWFAREHCDLVVLETGLGGRFDATNVVPNKLVAAITKIGFDHTEILGSTLTEIAAEKAGIITKGCTVVCYPDQPKEAMEVIERAAKNQEAALIVPDKDDLQIFKHKQSFVNEFDYGGYRVKIAFPGTHQAYHAAMAVEIALTLWREYDYDISDEAIIQGLAKARMPARMEVLRRFPLLLLDGCHNSDGVQALAKTLTAAGFEENLVGVMGVLRDKNHKAMLNAIVPCLDKLYCVTPDCPRALTGEELNEEAKYLTDSEPCDTVKNAIQKAINYAEEQNLPGVVVFGSLYLTSEARPILLEEINQ